MARTCISARIFAMGVLPAHAGMARAGDACQGVGGFVLPAHAGMARRIGRWGAAYKIVLPAHAGMARPSAPSWWASPSVLPAHAGMARGLIIGRRRWVTFSPHTRGWPDRPRQRQHATIRSPRTRGDGPSYLGKGCFKEQCSPRTRGDGPLECPPASVATRVLPAHAGMARLIPPPPPRGCRSPRTRGDGPNQKAIRLGEWLRSPRTRGDGPDERMADALQPVSSPRTRGDGPHTDENRWNVEGVLPAHAGMARGA